MPLPTSGPISLSNVNTELGLSSTAPINLGSSIVRTLFGVPSGTISKSNGRGKANRVSLSVVYSTNTQQATVNPTSLSGYVAGISDIVITVNSGIYVWSDSTSVPAMTINGGLATGDTITLINNGFIIGRGGDGVNGWLRQVGNNGGPALNLNLPITIDNTNASAYIAGGGGSGSTWNNPPSQAGSGGGAGGGRGGATDSSGSGHPGGAGGGLGQTGGNGAPTFSGQLNSGGGGGRILPGDGGVGARYTGQGYGAMFGRGGGAGASGTLASTSNGTVQIGGGGGGWGASGAPSYTRFGTPNNISPGDGGSANNNATSANGGALTFRLSGGAGGKAINLNGNSVTWVSGDTTRILGAVS
jgi:hypothetical protein